MTRTSRGGLLIAAAIGAAAGFLLDQLLTSTGRPTFIPSLMLPVLLVLLGAACVALALPIRRAIRGASGRVDPFRAVRVAMLAKASSIVGAVMAGLSTGLLVFLFTRPVSPAPATVVAAVAALAGGIVLLVAALYAEHLCIIDKRDDDDLPDEPTSTTPSHH